MFYIKNTKLNSFASYILNFIGGTFRYIYGTIWRTLFNKPKYRFDEYINRPDNSDYYDKMGHNFNNKWIAIVVIAIMISIIKYIRQF